ncbi:tetratricopeptide repeat protein [Joostella sp. CR20]|uniref:tetratricopeptide repeat protein n=1 Tax=Joostella sp. CR20 TaxID=2804312 RepID=UPI00313B4AD0
MRVFLLIIFFLIGIFKISAQDEAIAQQYFEKGDFEKAVVYYQKLYNKNPNNRTFVLAVVNCYQQLNQLEKSEAILLKKALEKNANPTYVIEAGYNYQLKNEADKATLYYDKALEMLNENPNYVYVIGGTFRQKTILDYAMKAYKTAMELEPKFNFNYELALIYGEQGDIENMYQMYLDLMLERETLKGQIKRNLSGFISEDGSAENNVLFKKIVLKRSQTNPNVLWNELLSWLFIQQHDYKSAFTQEKAIYKRSEVTSLNTIIELGVIAYDNEDAETARQIFQFVVEQTQDQELLMYAKLQLITIDLHSEKNIDKIEKEYQALLNEYGITPQTIEVQVAYAKFLAFVKNDSATALSVLKEAIALPLNKFSEAQVRMATADVLVFDEQFNQALIYYSQVQKALKNDVLGQEARFKVAQTSFYKGDFDWAETQLKVLKSSTSQLIANDALQLKLLISDNKLADSTQTALKLYAKADLLAFQENEAQAINLLDIILKDHKGEPIEDEALLLQASLLEKNNSYEKAVTNYQKIIEFFPEDILMDDALYNLAQLYIKKLSKPELAKKLLERIIFEHQDSIYFIDARKEYRTLRGDAIN